MPPCKAGGATRKGERRTAKCQSQELGSAYEMVKSVEAARMREQL